VFKRWQLDAGARSTFTKGCSGRVNLARFVLRRDSPLIAGALVAFVSPLVLPTPAWGASSSSAKTGGKAASKTSTAAHTYFSWGAARWIAIGAVLVAFVVIWLLSRYAQRRGVKFGGLFNGLDNRWSTSKVSIVLWTMAILWAFLAILIRYGASVVPKTVPAPYFALLGIPSAGALGAKAITNGTAAAGAKTSLSTPTNNPVAGIGQVLSDDTGAPDLLDSQYFLFNLLLLGYFVAGFFHISAPVGTDLSLPALPGSLLALAGISTGTYVGKKALADGNAPTLTVPPGSSVTVSADSDVTMPSGGKITLNSPGRVTIYPGITYTSQSAGTVKSAVGGELTALARGSLKLSHGARINAPLGTRMAVSAAATALLSQGSSAFDAATPPAPAQDAGSAGKQIPAGGSVTFGANGEIVVTNDDGIFEVGENTVISYAGAGNAAVQPGGLTASLSAGMKLGQQAIATVTFAKAGAYVDALTPGDVQRIDDGGTVQLGAGTPDNPERSIVLAEAASQVQLPEGTVLTFPSAPAPVSSGTQAVATTASTINLPSGGEIDIEPAQTVAAHVPSGSVVAVGADKTKSATITPTQ